MSIAADTKRKGALAWAGRALHWWLAELGALWREATERFEWGDGAVVLEAGERYWMVRQRDILRGQIDRDAADPGELRRSLQLLIPAGSILQVEIPQERVLAKRVALPLMAESELRRILNFEIERHFPFPAERLHFRHRVLARTNDGAAGPGIIEVELAAVPRQAVAEICAELAAAGLTPVSIALAADDRFVLAVSGVRRRRPRLGPRDRLLVIAALVFAVTALISPFIHQQVRLGAVERELASLKPQAQQNLDRNEREKLSGERAAALLRLTADRPPLVALIDRLTKAVPDGAWLLSLTLNGRDLVIDGLAPSAAAIALALEKSQAFGDVVFRAQITRDPGTGLEHFQLAAKAVEPKR
jgi:general secretion pathway protein L